MQSATDESPRTLERAASPPTGRSWLSPAVGAFAGGVVAFIWAGDVAPSGGEGLMGLESFFSRFAPALPRAMFLGAVSVMLANRLVALAPVAAPWGELPPPPETIDSHYKPAWLAAFATPLVVGPVFGLLPLIILSHWVRIAHASEGLGDGPGVVSAIGASLLLVPRLARAVMRAVDERVHARRS